jgi:hypothetical protein
MWITARLLLSAATLSAQPLAASADCGLCAKSVVVNSRIADCFLERYPQLSSHTDAAVAVDLEDCGEDRGVVAPLRGPQAPASEPSLRFILSQAQLACLKQRLEEVAQPLDPSLEIDLGDCE